MLEEAMQERRRVPRSMVSVPAIIYDDRDRQLLRARTIDLSAFGALLHGGTSIVVGDHVQLEVGRGEAKNPLRLDAEVVRVTTPAASRRQHSIALRFREVSELDAAILRSIIAEHRA
jgi:c-di-GMP-binding flagellar brake protein YcgR